MASFTYTAIDRTGKRSEGSLGVADKRTALMLLEKSGRIPVSIKEGAAPKAAASRTKWWKLTASTSPKMSQREVFLFTEELADLLSAGMTLGNALNSLASDPETPSGRVAADLRDRIIRGGKVKMLESIENVCTMETSCNTFMGLRNLSGRDIHVTEFLVRKKLQEGGTL